MLDIETMLNLTVLALEESMQREVWWYLSFADEKGFNGGIVVRGRGPITARLAVAELGLYPKGEAVIVRLGLHLLPEAQFRYRLLSNEELQAAFAASGGAVNMKGEPVEIARVN